MMIVFSASASDAKVLRDCIDTVSQIMDEGTIRLRKDGIILTAADRAMVAVVDLKIGSGAFESYVCDADKDISLNMESLLNVLKRAGPLDKINLKLNETENRLEVTLAGESIRNFALPLLELGKEEVPNVTQFQFNASAEVNSDVMCDGIDDATVISDSVMVELSQNQMRMLAEGDSSKVELKVSGGTKSLQNVVTEQTVKSRYPLDYLKKFMKAAKIADKFALKMGNDYPLRLDFVGNNVRMGFVLAPRVSEE